jgi:hypothetical protein
MTEHVAWIACFAGFFFGFCLLPQFQKLGWDSDTIGTCPNNLNGRCEFLVLGSSVFEMDFPLYVY